MTNVITRVRNNIGRFFGGAGRVKTYDARYIYSEELQKAADEGDIISILRIATTFNEGLGVKRDPERAAQYWKKAADLGNFAARLKLLSLKGYKLKDLYANKARKGPLDVYGFIYSQEAERAAEAGDLDAMVQIGTSYFVGAGIPSKGQLGFRYLLKAAEQGHSGAQYLVASTFQIGDPEELKDVNRGVPLYWATLSMLNGNPIGRDFYNELAPIVTYDERMTYTKVIATRSPKLLENKDLAIIPREIAFAYSPEVEEAAKAGDIHAMAHMGMSYTYGFGVQEDGMRGLNYWRAAHDRGHPGAQQMILIEAEKAILRRSARTKPSKTKSYTYSKKVHRAADAGDAQAMIDIATAFHEGLGVEPSPELALKYWEAAARKHHPAGQFWLSVAYDVGKNLKQDRVEALYWSFLSNLQGHEGGEIYYGHMFDKTSDEEHQKFAALFEKRQSHLTEYLRRDMEERLSARH